MDPDQYSAAQGRPTATRTFSICLSLVVIALSGTSFFDVLNPPASRVPDNVSVTQAPVQSQAGSPDAPHLPAGDSKGSTLGQQGAELAAASTAGIEAPTAPVVSAEVPPTAAKPEDTLPGSQGLPESSLLSRMPLEDVERRRAEPEPVPETRAPAKRIDTKQAAVASAPAAPKAVSEPATAPKKPAKVEAKTTEASKPVGPESNKPAEPAAVAAPVASSPNARTGEYRIVAVAGDRAWVKISNRQTLEVKPGTELPGLGPVSAVTKDGVIARDGTIRQFETPN